MRTTTVTTIVTLGSLQRKLGTLCDALLAQALLARADSVPAEGWSETFDRLYEALVEIKQGAEALNDALSTETE